MKGLALAAIISATPAIAQPRCAVTPVVNNHLATNYGEEVVESIDIPNPEDASQLFRFDLWANQSTGSWSITSEITVNVTCLFREGKGYHGQGICAFIDACGDV